MAKTLYVPVESLLDGYVSKEAKEIYVPVSDNGTYKSKRAVKAYCPDENGLSKLFWGGGNPNERVIYNNGTWANVPSGLNFNNNVVSAYDSSFGSGNIDPSSLSSYYLTNKCLILYQLSVDKWIESNGVLQKDAHYPPGSFANLIPINRTYHPSLLKVTHRITRSYYEGGDPHLGYGWIDSNNTFYYHAWKVYDTSQQYVEHEYAISNVNYIDYIILWDRGTGFSGYKYISVTAPK